MQKIDLDCLPFPNAICKISPLAFLLQSKIKIAFGIDVEPVIFRQRASYYHGHALAYKWVMRTFDRQFIIASYENAKEMAFKNEWRVLDGMLAYANTPFVTGKTIY
jgi:hypothetical protein